jgi:ribosomal protein L21E
MKDVPQPASTQYSEGDKVKIYLGPGDPDEQFHGKVCEVVECYSDDLDTETGRDTDAYSYSLRDLETEEQLPVQFRHHDLVPVNPEQ